MLGLLGLAVVAGLWFAGFGFGGDERDEAVLAEATPENIVATRNQAGCVVVLQAHKRGKPESEKLAQILHDLDEERYGDEVKMARFDVDRYPGIAQEEGVSSQTAPQLSFYIEGQRVGDYRGPWEQEPVQRKIDEVLRGYMQRIGKNWRPPVPGMAPDRGQQIIEVQPAAK